MKRRDILVRYRKRDEAEPDQSTGNRTLEIAWMAVSIGLVAVLFALSVAIARTVDHPADRPAADVIHDFWVPRLGRKIDAIPGRSNTVWIRANELHVVVPFSPKY